MAQTRKRRSTKHRGNAAGMVESRGRTGRRVEPSEKAAQAKKMTAQERRMQRLNTPPTWRGALNRAAIAALLFGVLMVIIGNTIPQAATFAAVMLLLYIPMSYYTDLFIYRRQQKKKAAKA
jgi:Mrp family chromosome partitioning ATPase